MGKKLPLLLLALALAALSAPPGPAAATGVNLGAAALEPATTGGLAVVDRALAKLSAHKRLLVVAAHPDDEDTALLTLVSRGMGGEAAYLSLSRGEGGQNLLGQELGVGLGLIRSRELLAARGIDGSRQYFTRAYDFGYTLSLERTLALWPKDAMVEDTVRVIRRFKPQVVVSVFPGVPHRNHGQHQVSGVAAFAAFPVAGDPAALPRLAAEGLAPWTPQALYCCTYFGGEGAGATLVTMQTSGIDPWTGKSIYQLAAASRSMHRSQDMGRLQPLGPQEGRAVLVSRAGGAPGSGAGVPAGPSGVPGARSGAPGASSGPPGASGAAPASSGHDIFAGIDTRLRAIAAPIADAGRRERVAAELDAVEALAVRTREQLAPERPRQAVAPLLEIVRRLRSALAVLQPAPPAAPETAAARATTPGLPPGEQAAAELVAEKLEVAQLGAAAAAGIAVDATTEREALTAGETFAVRAELWSGGGAAALERAAVILVPGEASPEWTPAPLRGESRAVAAGALSRWDLKPEVPAGAPPTMPYFLRQPLQGSLYDWSAAAPAERGEPFGPPPLVARFSFILDGVPLSVEREVVHRHRDEVLGEVRRPLRIVPAVEVTVPEALQVWPLARREAKNLRVVLTSHRRAPVHGRLEVTPTPQPTSAVATGSPGPAGTPAAAPAERAAWPAVPPRPFDLPAARPEDADEGEQTALAITLRAPPAPVAGRYPLRLAAVLDDGSRFDLAVPLIDYEHIRPTPYPHRAAIEISAFELKLPPLRKVGYVRGASDRVPEFLRQAGLPVELLGPGELAGGDLSRYDAIVIGSRAYESEPALPRANPRLLDYVRAGGLMIVQYQQYPFIEGGFAPYKLEIARPHDRVTDENARVEVLAPEHPVWNVPNKIGPPDWQGWVQERGLYFAHTWDPAYQPLLAMADPGGPEQRGSLLVAKVGKGTWVYTGLSLFRQLPAGVPGAYRLFANLLALRPAR
jgi:LmbE family N-acetylglucosaminyl deacetylase